MDLVFALQFVWLNGWELNGRVGSQACNGAVTFITQFTLMASLNWYLVMAANFYFSISNPFVKPQSKTVLYHVGCWSVAALTAVVAATNSGYRDDYRLCWVQKTSSGLNAYNWGLYFAWIACFAVVCGAILVWGWWKLRSNSLFADRTIATRQETLRQTKIYVMVFTLYWLMAAVIWFVVYLQGQGMCRILAIQTHCALVG